MSEEIINIIQRKAKSIDLGRVGLMATTEILEFYHSDPEHRFIKYMNLLKSFALAQAMFGNTLSEGAYVIRDISPMEDLLIDKERIKHNQWIQDYNIYRHGNDGDGFIAQTYTTNEQVGNYDKVYLIYGLEFTNPLKKTVAQRLEFWRGNAKLITWIDTSSISTSPMEYTKFNPDIEDIIGYDSKEDGKKEAKINGNGRMYYPKLFYHNPMIFLSTPIMYKRNDLMAIRVRFPNKGLEQTSFRDEIKIKGFVAESIGRTMMG